jgi:hypothetical protein
MTFVFKSLATLASTLTGAAATVVAVNHTEFGKNHAPECVKNACKATEEKTVAAAKAAKDKAKEAKDATYAAAKERFDRLQAARAAYKTEAEKQKAEAKAQEKAEVKTEATPAAKPVVAKKKVTVSCSQLGW